MTASIIALKKTTTKSDGGVYVDAIHKITAAKVSIDGPSMAFVVRLSMFKDQETSDAPGGESAMDESFSVDMADPVVAGAFGTLRHAVLTQAKARLERLSDAAEIQSDDG